MLKNRFAILQCRRVKHMQNHAILAVELILGNNKWPYLTRMVFMFKLQIIIGLDDYPNSRIRITSFNGRDKQKVTHDYPLSYPNAFSFLDNLF